MSVTGELLLFLMTAFIASHPDLWNEDIGEYSEIDNGGADGADPTRDHDA